MYIRNKRITLNSLVVTIIILLILAGISISKLTEHKSILGEVKEAKSKNSKRRRKKIFILRKIK